MFQVFVDSAANLPAVTAKKYDIHVVSFVNLVNGKELTQTVNSVKLILVTNENVSNYQEELK